MVDHAVKQLSHHQKRLAAAAAQGGDVLLGGGQLLQRKAAAQIAPGDGDHVAKVHPVRKGIQPRLILHLGEQLRVGKAVLRHGLPHGAEVIGAADEGLHDGADAQRRGLGQIREVCLTQGGAVQLRALRRQALVAGEDAAAGDAAPPAVQHGQGHSPIVQQDGHAGHQRRQHIFFHRDIRAQRHGFAHRQRQRGGESADAHLRPAEVDHQLGGQTGGALRIVEGVDPVAAGGQHRVGHVEPEAGDAAAQQCGQRGRFAAGGAQCGVISHGVFSFGIFSGWKWS